MMKWCNNRGRANGDHRIAIRADKREYAAPPNTPGSEI